MTRQGNGQSVPYDVRMSQQTRVVLQELHHQAVQSATAHEFLAALRQIVERLQGDPGSFGEAQYHLPALNLQVRQAIVVPIVVDFAVHQDRPLVFIRGFKVLS
jgi:hypothetical protein